MPLPTVGAPGSGVASPPRLDVLIVGGGVVGCCAAYHLARAGLRCVLIDRQQLGAGSSGANAGSLHAQFGLGAYRFEGGKAIGRLTAMLPVLPRGIEAWVSLERELGADFELKRGGGILATDQHELLDKLEQKVRLEQQLGMNTRMLDATAIRKIAPYLSDRIVGAAFCSDEGDANPLRVMEALRAALQKLQVSVATATTILDVSRSGGRHLVATTAGTFDAEKIVISAGADCSTVGDMFGVEIPTSGEPIQASVTEPAPPIVPHLVYYASAGLTLKQTVRGAFIIGGAWPAAPDGRRMMIASNSFFNNLRACRELIPATAGVRLIRSWPGLVNDTVDDLPILGLCPGAQNVFVATFPRFGFTAGAITARAVADMVMGRVPEIDCEPFRPARFCQSP